MNSDVNVLIKSGWLFFLSEEWDARIDACERTSSKYALYKLAIVR